MKVSRRNIGGGFPAQVGGLGSSRILMDEEPGEGTSTVTAPPPDSQASGGTQTQTPPSGQTQGLPPQYQQLIDAVATRTDEALSPMAQRLDQLESQMTSLSQTRQSGSGATPNRIFKSPQATAGGTWGRLERQGYRFTRAYGRMIGSQYLSSDATKLEDDVSQKLYKFYVTQGGMELGGERSILMPYGTSCIHDFEEGIADELRGLVAQGVHGADPDEIRHMAGTHLSQSGLSGDMLRQQLSMFDDTALGVFVSGGQQTEMIELVRNREVFSRAGASQITLPPNGHLPMPRQTGAVTGYWIGENAPITGSEPATGRIEMRARKSACLVSFPNELLRFATASVEAFLRMDMSRVLALLADLAFLEGTGTMTQPRGLLNYNGVIQYTAGTVAANGNTFEPEDPGNMIAEVEDRNHDLEVDEFTWAMRPKMYMNIYNRRTDAVSGSDGAGPWLFQTNRNDITRGVESRLLDKRVIKSSQISNTRVKGSSSDLTYVLGGIFRHWLIGNHGVMEFATATQGDTAFANDQTKLRAIRHVDGVPRYEDSFVVCDSIDPEAS